METRSDSILVGREMQWKEIQKFPKRKVSPEQLARDLERLEDKS